MSHGTVETVTIKVDGVPVKINASDAHKHGAVTMTAGADGVSTEGLQLLKKGEKVVPRVEIKRGQAGKYSVLVDGKKWKNAEMSKAEAELTAESLRG